jgi:hypothetical protein
MIGSLGSRPALMIASLGVRLELMISTHRCGRDCEQHGDCGVRGLGNTGLGIKQRMMKRSEKDNHAVQNLPLWARLWAARRRWAGESRAHRPRACRGSAGGWWGAVWGAPWGPPWAPPSEPAYGSLLVICHRPVDLCEVIIIIIIMLGRVVAVRVAGGVGRGGRRGDPSGRRRSGPA